MGNFVYGSPLALAFTTRGTARWCLGLPGWRDDLRHGLAMARSADPLSYATVVAYVYFAGIPCGVLRPDDSAMREIEDARRIAERSGDDLALSNARSTLGLALVHRQTAAERDRGWMLLAEASDVFRRRGYFLWDLALVDVYSMRERARRGDRDGAIPIIRTAVDHLFREGQLLAHGVPATGVLVETLLDRGAEADVAEAEAAIERLASAPADEGLVMRDIWLLRLRALLARAHGDAEVYNQLRDRYRAMAKTLGFEGHIAWGRGNAMTAAGRRACVTLRRLLAGQSAAFTAPPPNAKSYNESAAPSYRAQSCCATTFCRDHPLRKLPGEPHSRQIEWDPSLIIGVSD